MAFSRIFFGTQKAETGQEEAYHGRNTESSRARKGATVLVAKVRSEGDKDDSLKSGEEYGQKEGIKASAPLGLRRAGERQQVAKIDERQTGSRHGNVPGQYEIVSQNINELCKLTFRIDPAVVKIAVAVARKVNKFHDGVSNQMLCDALM